jgi:hypothetical protein
MPGEICFTFKKIMIYIFNLLCDTFFLEEEEMRYLILAVLAGIAIIVSSCSSTTYKDTGLPLGSPCVRSSDCADKLVCITTNSKDVVNLFPGGYCSRYCLSDKDCPSDGKCVGNICILTDCSRCTRNNYICYEGKYCVADMKVGDHCTGSSDCPTGNCMYGERFPYGYCTLECKEGGDCPLSAGGVCANFEGKEDSSKICAYRCKADSECRTSDKYACRLTYVDSAELGGTYMTVCSGIDNLGATCKEDKDCSSGLSCIDKSEIVKDRQVKGGDFSEKVCSKTCKTDKDCHTIACKEGDENCLKTARCIDNYCLRGCEVDEHCAKNLYACRPYEYEKDKFKYFCNSVASIGVACTKDEECTQGLKCLKDKSEYAGGFCTKDCKSDSDCPVEIGVPQTCVDGICQRACKRDSDCGRKGYLCINRSGKGICQSVKNYGAACRSDEDCSEGLICYRGYAFPDGYCTKKAEMESECEGGGVLGNLGLCMRKCDKDDDCKRDGYICFDNGPNKYCSTGFNIGFPCFDHEEENIVDCNEGLRCNNDSKYEYGYCTMDCEKAEDPCPSGSRCIPSNKMCMRECSRDDQCLISDYTCRLIDKVYVCEGGKNVGAACSSDGDCSKGLVCDTKQPNGYCTLDCKSADCPTGSVCVSNSCRRTCRLDKDCGRALYFCISDNGISYCKTGLNYGAECNSDEDCTSPLKCYKPVAGKTGMCSNSNENLCSEDGDCKESYAKCNKDGDKHCYRKCNADSDCGREDMKCSDSLCVYR